MTGLRTIAEIGIGVLFGVGAVFHAAYTLRHTDEFYGSFADGAWLSPARWVMSHLVLPNATAVTALLILFQGTVAVLILTRGEFAAALWAGAAFAGLAALASSPGGTAGNLALAVTQVILAVFR